MEFLFELVFSFLFEIVFALLAGAAEYAFYKTHKRIWMWVFGIAAIALMIWWRGAHLWTSYALAAGWLAVLGYMDWRLRS
jgi:hypothetical protein